MIALKKKLEAVETEVVTREELRKRYSELRDKESQLAVAQKKYSQKHPDVVKLTKEVARLKVEINELSKKQVVLKAEEEKPEKMHLLWTFFYSGLSGRGKAEELSVRGVQEEAQKGEPEEVERGESRVLPRTL